MKRLLLPVLFLTAFTACNKNGDDQATTSCRLNSAPYYFQVGGATVQLPNAFTPNGDGRNDYFRAIVSSGILTFGLAVYDHDGSVLFDTQDPYTNGWDGTKNGVPVAGGYYSVALQFKTVNGDLVNQQLCVALCVYGPANCIVRSNYGAFYFQDMLDPGNPTHFYGTMESICP